MAGWMMLIELLTKIDDLGWSGCGNTWSLHRIDCPPSTGKGGGEGKRPPESPMFNLDSACNHAGQPITLPPPEIRVKSLFFPCLICFLGPAAVRETFGRVEVELRI